MMDPEIIRFFSERKKAWLKKSTKESMDKSEIREKELECELLFSMNEWLPNAAKRAGSRAFSTHPSKFSHPSTGVGPKNRKNYTYVTPIIDKSPASADGFLRSGNVIGELDSLGNAAELDVDEFLSLRMEDGESVFKHLESDSDLAKALLTIKSKSYEELKEGFLAMSRSDAEAVTSSKIKQVYFPVDGDYHLLSVLTPSGIVFDLRKRLDKLRFGEEMDGVNLLKEVRDKKKKNEYHEGGYSEVYGLTTIGYGGTKPQNISVLNNRNGGKAHLFLSMPPSLDKRDIQFPNSDFFTQSVSYYQNKDLFYKLHDLYQKDDSNMYMRSARDEYYQGIIDRIVERMWQIRSVAREQYNPENSQLKHEQKVWLLDEYKEAREIDDDWLERITSTITQFIFHGYEKILAKKAVKLGDGEHAHMAGIVKKSREDLR